MTQQVSPLVLIIEDERPIRRFLYAALTAEGYRIVEAETGEEGLQRAIQQPPDMVILDLGLPDMEGQDVLRRLREWLSAPIIVLSARNQEEQKVKALDAGGNDYVTKPFGVGELLARMRSAFRHQNKGEDDATVLLIGDVRADLTARVVFKGDQEIHLTPLEYKLLVVLMKHAGKVLTHRYLLREVWGPLGAHEVHYLRVFIASLRRKLESDSARPRYLLTEQGVGYRFAGE
ncbi:MAG: response regulator [Planctomycetaceae bacterium]